MSDRFDLEQYIMQCWNVVDDIKMLMEYKDTHGMTEDQFSNALLGIQSLYQIRFELMWDCFEQMVSTKKL